MMNRFVCCMLLVGLSSGCSTFKNPISHQYKLTFYSADSVKQKTSSSILVTPTVAVSGYETNQMRYTTHPFLLGSFAKNNWVSPPGAMIYPLLIQSIQKSNHFSAVGSGVYFSKTTYRLDTQALEFQQNFTTRPSIFSLKMKATLTHVEDNQIVASRIFPVIKSCPQDTPFGGVFAANQAVFDFTRQVTQFAIEEAK